MPIDRAWYNTLVNDNGTGLTGTIWDKNSVNILLGLIDARVADWITLPYNAAHYAGSGGMTWTVDPGDYVLNWYCVLGNTMVWCVQLAATSLSGTPGSTLLLSSPRLLANPANFSAVAYPAGIYVCPVNAAQLGASLQSGAAWPNGTNNTYLYFTWIGEIA